MPFTHTFLVPEIYLDFRCKGGACRASCCENWDIAVSQDEYFRLLGMDCPPEIRRRLDCAFCAPREISPERFRLLAPRFDGDCPLRAEDGLCALQLRCGETALPAVCRLYPRAVHTEFAYECACSNSCEAVVEQLLAREAPLTFCSAELTFPEAPPPGRHLRRPRGKYSAVRQLCGEILQKRALPLPERLLRVGEALRVLEPLLDAPAGDFGAAVERLALCDAPLPPVAMDASAGFASARALLETLAADKCSLAPRWQAAAPHLPNAAAFFRERRAFAARFPTWERDLEQLLVHHLFYDRFPFSDWHERFQDEFAALCALYGLLRLLLTGYTAEVPTREGFADAAAAAFRLVEHTRFDHNAAVLLRRQGGAFPGNLLAL